MRRLLAKIFVVASVLVALPALAAEPLVSVEWLKANLGKPGLVVIDLRSGGGASREDFVAAHIPGSVFSNYAKDGWREKVNDVAGMLPAPAKLEKVIGALGIDNATHVVIAPLGEKAADMGAATRVYWTFKVMGHDDVSILDGGWRAWTKDVDAKTKKPLNPLASGDVKPGAKAFKANPRREMIATKEDVRKALDSDVVLVDNRPNDFYVGLTLSPAAKRVGTIPGARNMQESWLTRNNGGSFRTREQLAALYKHAGVPTQGDQISFCNTGHWASLGWFASSEILGNKKTRMYDGSMAEWTRDPDAPVEQKIKLD